MTNVSADPPASSTSSLRRYPALLAVFAMSSMALLLPSGLNVLQTDPPTLAEFAPVPGQSQGRTANLASFSPAASSGVGTSGGDDGVVAAGAPPSTTIAPRVGTAGKRRAGTKRCVGNPPRQTEDPLSPPCIAFWEGDNGGATAKGVTGSEIRVVFRSDCATGRPTSVEDLDSSSTSVEGALVRYFNDRFQTYGRRVHAWWYSHSCEDRDATQGLPRDMNEKIDPFAVIGGDAIEATGAARLGIWANLSGTGRARMSALAPMLRSFKPDREDFLSSIASFTCNKLAGRPARYSGDALDRARTRRFGLSYWRAEDTNHDGQGVLLHMLADRCGDAVGNVLVQDDANEAVTVARWRQAGVTTIFHFGSGISFMHEVDASGWQPEWFHFDDSSLGNSLIRTFWPPTQSAHMYALTEARRLPEHPEDQELYRAMKSYCPSCPPNTTTSQTAYDETMLLFWGIQAAGPRLTIANVDRGLHAIPPRPSPNPWTPAAYFAPGNWSFVKDVMLAMWDPAGVAPSGQPGCWRLVESGKRYRAEDWATSPGDDGFDRFDEWPCHASE